MTYELMRVKLAYTLLVTHTLGINHSLHAMPKLVKINRHLLARFGCLSSLLIYLPTTDTLGECTICLLLMGTMWC